MAIHSPILCHLGLKYVHFVCFQETYRPSLSKIYGIIFQIDAELAQVSLKRFTQLLEKMPSISGLL